MSDSVNSLEEVIGAIVKKNVKEAVLEALKQAPDEDRLLDTVEAAKMLSVSEDWLYRNAKRLPFSRKLGPKMLRFSYTGMKNYLSTRNFS